MESNDSETLLRQFTLLIASQDTIEVLIMAKRHQHFVQATVGLVHAILGAVEENEMRRERVHRSGE